MEAMKRDVAVIQGGIVSYDIPLDVADWIYQNEGGAHIIVSYIGTHPVLKGKVLRLKKQIGKAQYEEFASYHWKQKILSPLLGSDYIELGIPVKVNSNFLRNLSSKITFRRPKHRLVHKLDFDTPYGLLLNNLTLLPESITEISIEKDKSITVDIKPKCGTLPFTKYIKNENVCKRRTCRYCMHQFLKMKEHSVKRRSTYCPIDLYSQTPSRMKKAFYGMLATPQNNLKIYDHGRLIFAGKLGGKTKETTDQLESLRKEIKPYFIANGETSDPTEVLVDVLVKIFQQEAILKNLRRAQKMDAFGIEGIYYLYRKFKGLDVTEDQRPENWEQLDCLSEREALKAIEDFLLASTAKDCSVMITLCPFRSSTSYTTVNNLPVARVKGSSFQFVYRITLVDIDSKPAENIETYYRVDQRITSFFSKLSVSKTCQVE